MTRMNDSYTCPRCWNGHPVGERCRNTTSDALDAHRPTPVQLQQSADAAESLALVRYHLSRSR